MLDVEAREEVHLRFHRMRNHEGCVLKENGLTFTVECLADEEERMCLDAWTTACTADRTNYFVVAGFRENDHPVDYHSYIVCYVQEAKPGFIL